MINLIGHEIPDFFQNLGEISAGVVAWESHVSDCYCFCYCQPHSLQTPVPETVKNQDIISRRPEDVIDTTQSLLCEA